MGEGWWLKWLGVSKTRGKGRMADVDGRGESG